MVRRLATWLGPLAGLGTWFALRSAGMPEEACLVAGLTVLVASWWIFEPIAIAFTSLLPLALLPALGVLSAAEVGAAYGNPLILLLLGGFMLSQGLAKSGVHRRIAVAMVNALGGRGGRSLVFGFMAASALLSMWISNTATALMLLPIALAALEGTHDRRLTVALLLGIAYAASVGGIGTPIGTPPNLIYMEVYRSTTGIELSFSDYLQLGLPVVFVLVPCMALWLTRGIHDGEPLNLPLPGRWRPAERRVLAVFGAVALAWVTRSEPFGGWSDWLGVPGANDAGVAFLGCIAMALIADGEGGRLLDWPHAVRIPWSILLLFGSGVALADSFASSGLSSILGTSIGGLIGGLPMLVVLAGLCLAVTFLTEVTSNTATATLLMPVIAAAAVGAGFDPQPLMAAVAMSASCAFMLPAATGPNAVVYGSERMTIAEMAREGFVLNLVGAALITGVVWLILA